MGEIQREKKTENRKLKTERSKHYNKGKHFYGIYKLLHVLVNRVYWIKQDKPYRKLFK